MKKYLFLFLFLSCLWASCGEKAPVIPPQHVNKFTCKVNGVFWEAVPKQLDILGNNLQMDKNPFGDFASIIAINEKKNQTMSFNLSLNDSLRTFTITDDRPFSDYGRKCVGYFLDTLTSRKVTVTDHDKTKQIAKGTFSFRAIKYSDSCKDTVMITEGLFDMHY